MPGSVELGGGRFVLEITHAAEFGSSQGLAAGGGVGETGGGASCAKALVNGMIRAATMA